MLRFSFLNFIVHVLISVYYSNRVHNSMNTCIIKKAKKTRRKVVNIILISCLYMQLMMLQRNSDNVLTNSK